MSLKENKKEKVTKQSVSITEETNRRIYRYVRDGAVGEYLSGYDKTCERYQNSWFYQKFSDLKKMLFSRETEEAQQGKKPEGMDNVGLYEEETLPKTFKDRFASAFDNSMIVMWLSTAKDRFLHTPLVTYGVMVFAFALFMLMSQTLTLFVSLVRSSFVMRSFFSADDNILLITYMVVAVVLMTVSLTLMFARKGSLISFLGESRFSGFFMRHFAGIRSSTIQKKTLKSHNGKAFIFGMCLGLLTFVLPPWFLFAFLGLTAFVAVVMNIPEFGLVFLVFVLPFLSFMDHPTYAVVAISFLILLSLFVKVLRGKRSIRFEPADLYIVLFMVLILFGGIFTFGGMASFRSALVFCSLGQSRQQKTVLLLML